MRGTPQSPAVHRIAARAALGLALLAAAARPAAAQTSAVTSRGGLSNDGQIAWSTAAPNYATLANPFTVLVAGTGITATVSQASGTNFQRLEQGNGWSGNFANGASLLWTAGQSGPISLTFDAPISGFGVQWQSNNYGSFTAMISAFDASDNLLGSYSAVGSSNGNGDDSAIFLGIASGSENIYRILLSVPTPDYGAQDFAINNVTIQTTSQMSTVPEPTSMALLGSGLVGIAGAVRRRRKA